MIRSLAIEVGRRLDAFSETVTMGERVRAIDVYCQKLVNSDHSLTTIRGILVSGLSSHVRRAARSRENGTPPHRSANQSAGRKERVWASCCPTRTSGLANHVAEANADCVPKMERRRNHALIKT